MRDLQQLHAHLLKTGQAQSTYPASKLIQFCALSPSGSMAYAQRLLPAIESPDTFTFNTMIRGYTKTGAPKQALLFFVYMIEIAHPPNTHTFPFVLKACAHVEELKLGQSLHAHVVKLGFLADMHIQTALVSLYSVCSDLEAAQRVFDRITHRTVASWNSMISGYVKGNLPKRAFEACDEMLQVAAEPDEVTVASLLCACADTGALGLGRWLHDYIAKKGIKLDAIVGTALIDMYAKCGSIERAEEVFGIMHEKNVLTWTAMMWGLAMCDRGESSLGFFYQMLETTDIKPDAVTFVTVLSACSHTGLVDEGRRLFACMTRDFGIEPRVEHFGCMVDLFSRAGLVDEALKLMESMPLEPDAALLGSILSACSRSPGHVELAESVASPLLALEPDNEATYVLLSNIYASENRWDDVVRVRKRMKARGMTKTPGSSLIEVGGQVYEFIAGDKRHPLSNDIHKMVEEIERKVKEMGYVMDISEVFLDLDGDMKKEVLLHHSEKLAVAFGLISMNSSEPIRISKNLRICGDCHSMLKMVSMVYSRELIVRDRSRFHRFREGSCSCGDFW
ncbi:pentatricopeptide repeat-containing protein At5g66520-like [Amborella trichopoda]|uniref:pentatricopeptide repeat-containing protein At5g66520-like n=1 Tax=Amborella trichopoda TaxID=13333 RepID=UPI0009BD0319|nr:pentatricopeptide repeat-containing protein At5g66520-like [Amborella trichopoda]|eukprot:XP_011629038.2 pentatricopeptide repeat-containing protein At5g66520-like [Amborella trichopoda]